MPVIGIGISPMFQRSGSSAPQPTEIGSLVDSADFYNSGNWTVVGSPSVTFNASSIDFTAAGLYPNFDNGIVYNPFISCRSIIKWQVDAVVNSSTHGIAVSFKDYATNSSSGSFNALFGFNGTFGNGSISMRKGLTQYASATYPVAPTNGDVLRLTVEIAESLVRCSMQNITTGGGVTTATANFVYTYNFTQPYQQNTYKIALNTLLGNFRLSNLSCSTTAYTQCYLVVGNSKTATAFPNSFANAFVGRLKTANPTKNIYYDASINETIDQYLARIEDLKVYQPTKVFLVDSSNEQRFSTTNVATKMTSFKTQLEAIGAEVWYVNTMPENSLDVRTINGVVEPVFTPNVLDAYTLMVNPASVPNPQAAYISADGVHPNSTFQDELETLIQPQIL